MTTLARRRDRLTYLHSHPVLFGLLALTRRFPVLRLGRTVVVSGTNAVHEALTHLPLDRIAAGTTGRIARDLVEDGILFDEDGQSHRGSRRLVGDDLSGAGVDRLRPVWTEVLDRRCQALRRGESLDIVDVTAEMAGATVVTMLSARDDAARESGLDARQLAHTAREFAAAAARLHVPGLHRPGGLRRAAEAAARLQTALGGRGGLAAILAVAAVNTTVAGAPRAVAWCADARLWTDAADDDRRPVLADELLRVVSATPLLPRVAAADGVIDGHRIRAGDKLLLVSRHAVDAHWRDPDCADPAPAQVTQLAFGAGPHACPGARLARAQLCDMLRTLAPFRPVVVRARADRRSALPGWKSLWVRAR